MLNVVDAVITVKRRNPLFAETKMIGAVKVTFLRIWIGTDGTLLFFCFLFKVIVQLRIAVTDDRDIVHFAIDIQAVVVWLGEQYDEGQYLPVHRHWVVRENKWRASRWSIDTEIIIDEEGALQPLTEAIEELLEMLEPVSKRLGSYDDLMHNKEIIKVGPSFKRQRGIYEKTGDFKKVMEAVVQELRENRKITA